MTGPRTSDADAVGGVVVRPATVADVAAVARVWREGWADGHAGHVPAALVAERTPASFDPRALERIDRTWVAEGGGVVAGFVVVVDDEVEQVYVDRDWRGQGVAERLLRHAEAVIGRGGRRTAWLAVVAGNTRARRFYARMGWRDRGPFTYLAQTAGGSFPVPTHRYEREVGDGAEGEELDAGRTAVAAPGSRDRPPPSLDGAVRFDEQARAAAAEDFGHLVHQGPEGVLLPASAGDIAATVRWAAAGGRRFAAQGNRHSVFGRAQVRDGIVADLRRLRAVHDVQDERVVVDAGATWREVLAATLPRGLAPPVLPDYLDLSVGGTLVVGGVGSRTWRHGAVSDNVVELRVVTGRGEQVSCSPTRNPRLFDAVRAGLGQVAVITRATLPLVPAPQGVRRFLLSYPDLATMLADQRRLAGEPRFGAVQGAVLAGPAGGWMFRLDVVRALSGSPPDDASLLAGLADDRPRAQPSTLPFPDYLGRLDALEQALRASGQWWFPHPWLTTFVGDAAVEPVVAGELARLTPADLGPLGQVALSPILRESVTSPLLRLPEDRLCHVFNLIRLPATDDQAGAQRLVAANRVVYERVRDAGGTLYPVSALPMSPADWRGHFGSAFGLLSEAKHEHDPGRVLTPGYEVFGSATR